MRNVPEQPLQSVVPRTGECRHYRASSELDETENSMVRVGIWQLPTSSECARVELDVTRRSPNESRFSLQHHGNGGKDTAQETFSCRYLTVMTVQPIEAIGGGDPRVVR